MILDRILSANTEADLTVIALDLLKSENLVELITEMSANRISFDQSFEFDIAPRQIQDSIKVSKGSPNYDLNRNLHDRLLLLSNNNLALKKSIDSVMQKFYD